MKKNKKNFFKKYLLLFLILGFALFLRILWLDRIPPAISNDELDYVIDAKAIFLTGNDFSGFWRPYFLTPPPKQFPKAELPSLIVAPLIGPFHFSLMSARLPYAFLGIIFILVLFLIAKKFWGYKTALLVSLIASINPWCFYFSRTAFDAPLAILFYFVAFSILLSTRGWKILFTFLFLFLAFFSYIGTKIIFLPFVFLVCFYSWYFVNKRKFTKQYLILILLSFFLMGWFLFSLKRGLVGNRANEILTPFHPLVLKTVDEERRLSVDSFLTPIFSNKLIVFFKIILERYFKSFSPELLFIHGEGRATFSVWHHGMFYYLDLLFLLLGFYFLFAKNKPIFFLFVFLIFISPFPAIISNVGGEYVLRGGLLYPVLILIVGFGLTKFLSYLNSNHLRVGAIVLFIFLYFLQLFNFLNIYFFRNPIYNSEGFGFSTRVLFRYINLAKSKAKRVLLVTGDGSSSFKQNIFYSNLFDEKKLREARSLFNQNKFQWENVYFLSTCPEKLDINENDTVIVLSFSDCLKENSWLSISQLSDGGEVYRIFNDSLCKNFILNRYPPKIKFRDFKLEDLSEKTFCQKFISDLTGYSSGNLY